MKTPTKFVNQFSDAQRQELRDLLRTSNEPVRRRAHAGRLRSRGSRVDWIADISEVVRDPVSHGLDRWEDAGATGLHDPEGRGRNPTLTQQAQPQAIKSVARDPRSSNRSRAKMEPQTGKQIRRQTLKRILKNGQQAWQRLRRSSRGHRDEVDVQAAKAEWAGFRAQAAAGAIDCYSLDPAGFPLDPGAPSAWQTVGETIELPAASSARSNVRACVSPELRVHPFRFAETMDSEIGMAGFHSRSQILTQPTWVVIEGAPAHKSDLFQARLEEGEAGGF